MRGEEQLLPNCESYEMQRDGVLPRTETTHKPGLTRAQGTWAGTCARLFPGQSDSSHVIEPSFGATTRPFQYFPFLRLSMNLSTVLVLGELPGSGTESFKAPGQKAPGRALGRRGGGGGTESVSGGDMVSASS